MLKKTKFVTVQWYKHNRVGLSEMSVVMNLGYLTIILLTLAPTTVTVTGSGATEYSPHWFSLTTRPNRPYPQSKWHLTFRTENFKVCTTKSTAVCRKGNILWRLFPSDSSKIKTNCGARRRIVPMRVLTAGFFYYSLVKKVNYKLHRI